MVSHKLANYFIRNPAGGEFCDRLDEWKRSRSTPMGRGYSHSDNSGVGASESQRRDDDEIGGNEE